MTINQLIKELMRIQTKHGKKIKVYIELRQDFVQIVDQPIIRAIFDQEAEETKPAVVL